MSDLTGLVRSHNSMADEVAKWEAELDEYLGMMLDFSNTDPTTVMEQISSMAARLIQIRCEVVRSENRAKQAFRTKQLDPVLDQIDLQFKIHSRRLSSLTFDWETSKGQM